MNARGRSLGRWLDEKVVLVSDGATGTNLQARGLSSGEIPEDWVIDRPGDVLDLHRSFVDAGSDIILTCTFGGNPIRFGRSKYGGRADEMNRSAAQLAREAAEENSRQVLVGGSMGPTGEMMEPFGTLSEEVVRNAYAQQAQALVAGGVDFVALETFFAIEEASAALLGVRSVTDLPIVLTFSYDRGTRTMMGVSPTKMVEAFREADLASIGANCGTTLENMEEIVRELAAAEPGVPIWAKPNAGVPVGIPPVFPVDPKEMGAYSVRLIDAGARVVGGCCGSTAEHIRQIAEEVWKKRAV